jgi:hypothetical protein
MGSTRIDDPTRLLFKYCDSGGLRGLVNGKGDIIVEAKHAFAMGGVEYGYLVDDRWMSIVDWNGSEVRRVEGYVSYSAVSEGFLSIESERLKGYLSLLETQPDIPVRFKGRRDFHGGFAAVMVCDKEKNYWGLIGTNGEYVVEPEFMELLDFTDGSNVAPVATWGRRKEPHDRSKWGLVDKLGKVVVPPVWPGVRETFHEGGMVVVMDDGRTSFDGIVDEQGHWRLAPVWPSLSERIYEGTIGAKKSNVWGVIDLDGNWVIEPKFAYCSGIHFGVARVAMLGDNGFHKYGVVDKSGDWIVKPIYDDMDDFQFGFARVEVYDPKLESSTDGVIDTNGNEIVSPWLRSR